jgi:ABC-type branched-subunit amino acid transport system ATPase component
LTNDQHLSVNEHPPAAALQANAEPEDRVAASPPLLAVDGLHRSFGGVHAVAGASFTVQAATITGLIGPNGAGKSTVMGLIGGQLRPTSGRVLFEGTEVSGQRPHQVAGRGLIRTFQTANLFGRLTVMENLLLGARPWGGESVAAALAGKWSWRAGERRLVEQAREVLGRFQMDHIETEYAANLSGGQKRIVEIMRALMARPRLLLLDEPMAGVNPALIELIGGYILDLKRSGVTVLMVEHNLNVVEQICDYVIVLAEGRTLATGRLSELRENTDVVKAYLGEVMDADAPR